MILSVIMDNTTNIPNKTEGTISVLTKAVIIIINNKQCKSYHYNRLEISQKITYTRLHPAAKARVPIIPKIILINIPMSKPFPRFTDETTNIEYQKESYNASPETSYHNLKASLPYIEFLLFG